MKKILLTGGGTAGHVTPNIALIPQLKEAGYKIYYVGSYEGIEKTLIQDIGIPYAGISSGKLRRYIDLKNMSDPFRVLKGYGQARRLLRKLKPDIVFSKGGYVSVPVVLAAKHKHIPVIIHESDLTPGLANKIAFPAASWVCCNFPETIPYLPEGRAILSGSPIRKELFAGSPERAKEFTGLTGDKPTLLVIGGSLGSAFLKQTVRSLLPQLLERFQIVHLCGKGHLDPSLDGTEGYRQYEYLGKELPDVMALAEIVISRAGANSICELLALHKPNILIPLSKAASRGDQILNARSFEKQGFSVVIEEDEMTDEKLLTAISSLWENRQTYIDAMSQSAQLDAVSTIVDLIEKTIGTGEVKDAGTDTVG